MSLSFLKTNDEQIQGEKDSVGGGYTRESDVYRMKIVGAYLSTSSSGAHSLNVTFKDGDGEIKQTFWITSGKEKGCKPYYEKDGKKTFLPGFLQANSLCLLTADKEISDMVPEQKLVNIYNADAKKEVPTQVPVLMDIIGKEIKVGLLKQTVNKNVKGGDGTYHPTNETRDENEVDKLFSASNDMTSTEIKAQAKEATFINTWLGKWKGVTKNKVKEVANSKVATSIGKPATSLFGA